MCGRIVVFFVACCFSVTLSQHVKVKLYTMEVMKKEIEVSVDGNVRELIGKEYYDKMEVITPKLSTLNKNFLSNIGISNIVLSSNNIIKLMPSSFETCPPMTQVNLTHNRIKIIPENIFTNTNISDLNLSFNEIDTIEEDAFSNMPLLINIDLRNNNIKNWNQNWFYKTPQLSRLQFSNNKLQELPANAFQNLIGEKKYGNIQMKLMLYFSYNDLKTVTLNAFDGLKEIDKLWLDHNHLTTFNEAIVDKIKINELRLDSNEINRLSGEWKKLLNIQIIDLDSNPFHCDFINEMKKWCEINNKKVSLFYSDMNCRVDRIKGKMDDLKRTLEKLKNERTSTPKSA